MIVENDEEREKTKLAVEEGQRLLKECEDKWRRELVKSKAETEACEEEILALKVELDKAKMQHSRALMLNAVPKEDPIIQILKDKITELEKNLAAVEAGKQAIIDENILL